MLAAKILCDDSSLFSSLNTLILCELYYAVATVRPNSDGDTSPKMDMTAPTRLFSIVLSKGIQRPSEGSLVKYTL
jgi:hypothetical protein